MIDGIEKNGASRKKAELLQESIGGHSQNLHTQGQTPHTILTEKVIVYKPFQRDRKNRRYGLCTIRSRCRR